MPSKLLTSAVPEYNWPTSRPSDPLLTQPIGLSEIQEPKDLAKTWMSMLATPNNCSRHAVYNQYDSTVRADTVVHPGSDAGVVRVKTDQGHEKAIAITLDCNSRFCAIDAERGTALSLAEACRNIAATGATPIGISDCLNMPSPEVPETMWQIAHSIKGLGEAARAFDVPVVSGNVSLYNQTHGQGIQPTPLLAVVGLLADASKAIDSTFKNDGDVVFLLGETKESDLGGSSYLAEIHNIERGALPELDYELEKRTCDCVRFLIEKKLLSSCHDVSQGGLAVTLAEACFSDYLPPRGVSVTPIIRKEMRRDALLFSESGARFLISCSPSNAETVRKLVTEHSVLITAEGTVGGTTIEVKHVAAIPAAAYQAWHQGLDHLFKD
jgi:phosphoribosylformylglycinamidine synthase